MNLAKFGYGTFVGCVPWMLVLTYLLGENRDEVGDFLHYLDHAVALALMMGSSNCSRADALDLRARNRSTD